MNYKEDESTTGLLKYIIGICVAALIILMIIVVSGVFGNSDNKKKANPIQSPITSAIPQQNSKDSLIGIVKDIKVAEGVFTLLLIDTGEEQIFTFDGTTSFTSRYNQPLTAGEVAYGEIVEITFEAATGKLKTCDITDKAWEYKEIGKWEMDKTSKSIIIGSKTYQYSDIFYAYDQNGGIDTNLLSSKDLVTIKGIGGQAYSIIVTKGHGFVMLTGYEAFLEGTIEIGYDIITTVTDNMILPLREGEYKVTITKDGLSATKYIKLIAGEDYTLDFSEYKAEKVNTGKCYFDITPSGADLYIDNVQTDYTKPIELKYGNYEIRVECAGYQTYYAKLKVADEKEVLTITLVDENTSVTATPSPGVSVEDTNPSSTPTTSPTTSPMASPTTSPTASPNMNSTNKIHINAPAGAYVYLNDQYKGVIPTSFDKVIGDDMRLTLMMTGKDSKTYTVTVKNDGYDVVWSFDQWWQ